MNNTPFVSLLFSLILSVTTSAAFADGHSTENKDSEDHTSETKAVKNQSVDSGTWTKKYQKIHGAWKIEKKGDAHYLVLDEKFKTRKAPDLKFVLSNHPLEDVNGKNAMQGALIIENLKSNKGAQRYRLPDNFKDYSTLLLHCEQFSKLWGAASLTH